MKIEELYAEISNDFPINKAELRDETVKTSRLFVKYIKLFSTEKLRLEKLINDKKNIIHERRDFWKGLRPAHEYIAAQMTPPDLSSAEIVRQLETDPVLVKYDEQLIVQREKVEVLKAALDHINRRTYDLGNAIKMTIFENGG